MVTEHMTAPAAATAAAERVTVIEGSKGERLFGVADLGAYRELLLLLAWRDIKVRYKQTVIGAGWAVIQPLLTMVVFTLVFAGFAHVSSGGRPYAVLVFVALLPWQLFSQAVLRSTTSLVSSAPLVSKIYFPRIIIPLAALGAPLFDFCISLVVLAGLMIGYGVAPTWGIVLLPVFILVTLLAALAGGVWLTALNARFRDVGYVIPFALQLGLYLSPVAYPLSAVPERWRTLYELNPIAGVVQGFRWALIGDTAPSIPIFVGATLILGVMLFTGLAYFSRLQRTVADLI
jgi:lipopolysaccharide transport system permease protein